MRIVVAVVTQVVHTLGSRSCIAQGLQELFWSLSEENVKEKYQRNNAKQHAP